MWRWNQCGEALNQLQLCQPQTRCPVGPRPLEPQHHPTGATEIPGNGTDDDCDASTSDSAFSLIGHWTFEPGYEQVDLTGNWGTLQLLGSASISGGQLDVNASPIGWARAPVYAGGTIREKTLVSWVTLDSLARAGSAMTIDNISGDNFDAIVFAERQTWKWMAGSSYFSRTQDAVSVNDTDTTNLRQMAISYEDLGGGNVAITICKDGVQIGAYSDSPMAQWSGSNAEILFGTRHTTRGTASPRQSLDAHIEEARIYDEVLTCAEVATLSPL